MESEGRFFPCCLPKEARASPSKPSSPHGHWQLLLLVFRSVIVQRITPGGVCKLAVPVLAAKSALISTRRSAVLCSTCTTQPRTATLPLPVKAVPLQQKR